MLLFAMKPVITALLSMVFGLKMLRCPCDKCRDEVRDSRAQAERRILNVPTVMSGAFRWQARQLSVHEAGASCHIHHARAYPSQHLTYTSVNGGVSKS